MVHVRWLWLIRLRLCNIQRAVTRVRQAVHCGLDVRGLFAQVLPVLKGEVVMLLVHGVGQLGKRETFALEPVGQPTVNVNRDLIHCSV